MNDLKLAAQIAEREAEILGQPPRIPPQNRQAVAHEVRSVTRVLRQGIFGGEADDAVELPLDSIPEIMFTLCQYPDLWGKIMALSLQMQSDTGLLPPRTRQLAILRTAWLLQAPYEWGEHVRHSRRIGFDDADIAAVRVGSADAHWDGSEAAVLRAAEELRAGAMICDATWTTLAERLDQGQMFELLVLIGHFTNVAYAQNALRLRLEPNNVGLSAS